MKKLKLLVYGFFAGVVNGMFGSGGGLIVVPILKKCGLPPQKAHATSIAIILPLSIITTATLIISGVTADAFVTLATLPAGLIGAAIGAQLLKKIKGNTIRLIFAVIMIVSAVRILIK